MREKGSTMPRSKMLRLGAAAVVAAAGLLAAPLRPSSADSVTSTPHVHLYSPRAVDQGSSQNLIYNGGPVMQQTSVTYPIFWLPPGSHVAIGYQGLIERYFSDVGGSTLYNNLTQYYEIVHGVKKYIQNSSSLGGSWTDTSPYPKGPISDAQIQAEVVKAMKANGWTGGLTHEFFVYIGDGKNTCIAPGVCIAQGGFCAYHGYFASGGTNVIYANMPYPFTGIGSQGASCILVNHAAGLGPNHNPAADAAISITSHEHNESVTDPLLNAWFDAVGFEIGDKCSWNFGTIQRDGSNITMNGNPYLVQQEWNNNIVGCALVGP